MAAPYPPSTLVVVQGLAEPQFLVEIEAIAVCLEEIDALPVLRGRQAREQGALGQMYRDGPFAVRLMKIVQTLW